MGEKARGTASTVELAVCEFDQTNLDVVGTCTDLIVRALCKRGPNLAHAKTRLQESNGQMLHAAHARLEKPRTNDSIPELMIDRLSQGQLMPPHS